MAEAGLSGRLAFVVADAETGEVLESLNPDLALPPASATKIATALYGLEILGPDYRFPTRVVVTGPVENGQVRGDLYLVGGGDPSLDSDALAELAARLKQAGIREVAGRCFVHSGALPYQRQIDPGQPDYLGYNPAISGLNLNYNRVFFEWTRQKDGYAVTMDARALKYRPRVTVSTMSVVERGSPVFTLDSTDRGDRWTVAARVLGRKGGRWLPVRRPDLYAAEVFRTLARSNGLQLPEFSVARMLPPGTVVATWQSRPLAQMVRRMMKFSTNLTAECIGLTASLRQGRQVATLRDSARAMEEWAQARAEVVQARFADHSGLEDGTRVSPRDLVRLLLAAGWDGPLRGLMKDIPFRDARGRPLKRKAPARIRAKTGTLNFVSALAGYVEPRRGRRLVFAILAADLPRREQIRKADRERPRGARRWNRRARRLQQQLIERWIAVS